ncbi:MAG: response regulator transcription factor [Verrucomicrobia bacterium]|nr:response regulator transcription factor [Verrucomicrobiota bacterium]
MSPITILLAEDHALIREGLQAILQAEADMQVIGEAENGRQAVELTCQLHPDVVIMDISMPLLNGIEATRQIMQPTGSTKVLVFSSHRDVVYIEQAMAAGAAGYLLKQTDTLLLPDAIRSACHGAPFICPGKPASLSCP